MPGRGLELAIAIKLIAKEIGHEDRPGRDLLDQRGQARLIDLKDARARRHVTRPGGLIDEGGGDAEDQVGATLIGDRLPAFGIEDMPQQRRGRRLAVGTGNHDGALVEAPRELGQNRGVDPA